MDRWDEVASRYMFKTDKFNNGYGPLYRELIEPLGTRGRILEIGVWKGGSIDMWKELCPDGIVVGVDNCEDHGKFDVEVPEGIVVANQDDPLLPRMVSHYSPEFDIIIDDASHVGSLSVQTFGLLWPLVMPGGWYVLEDYGVGIPGNYPFYGNYEGNSMLALAQEFVARAGRYSWRADSDVEEFRGRTGIIAIRKR